MIGRCTLVLSGCTLDYDNGIMGYRCDKCGYIGFSDSKYCAGCGRKVKDVITTEWFAKYEGIYSEHDNVTILPYEIIKLIQEKWKCK